MKFSQKILHSLAGQPRELWIGATVSDYGFSGLHGIVIEVLSGDSVRVKWPTGSICTHKPQSLGYMAK